VFLEHSLDENLLALLGAVDQVKAIADELCECLDIEALRHRHFANICLHFVLEASKILEVLNSVVLPLVELLI